MMKREIAGAFFAVCLLVAVLALLVAPPARADESTSGDLHGKPDSHRVVVTHPTLTASATLNSDGTWSIRGTTIDAFDGGTVCLVFSQLVCAPVIDETGTPSVVCRQSQFSQFCAPVDDNGKFTISEIPDSSGTPGVLGFFITFIPGTPIGGDPSGTAPCSSGPCPAP